MASMCGNLRSRAGIAYDVTLYLLVFAHDLVRYVCQLFGIMRLRAARNHAGGAQMQRKAIISCSVTGSADTPGKNPAVPLTRAQTAHSPLDTAKAGAAIVHIHVRDPQT